MEDTAFDRGDEPGPRTALGYLEAEGLRTNVLHLPVRGSGDGGIVTTAADVRAFWTALFAGRLVPPEIVARSPPRRTATRTASASGSTRPASRSRAPTRASPAGRCTTRSAT